MAPTHGTAATSHRIRAEPRRQAYLWQFVRGLLFVQFLLFATWNNSGYSYVGWVTRADTFTALMAVAGILLLIAQVTVIRIAYLALGDLGIAMAALLLGVVLLIGSRFELIDLAMVTRHIEFWMSIAAGIVSIGVGWAKYQERISGQRDQVKSPP
jgi:hypothetical protein